MEGEIVVLCYNGKLEYSLEYTYAWARSSLMRERDYICDVCSHFCVSVAEKWLGANVRWEISQIYIEQSPSDKCLMIDSFGINLDM